MKGKIDKEGRLWLERAGKLKQQRCLYSFSSIKVPFWCEDDCPAFGEPVLLEYQDGHLGLELCKKTWVFDEFEDER